MPINPMDIMRTQEVTQLKHMETQRSQYAQEQISRNFQSMVEHEQNKTKETNKPDNPEYRFDAKEKGKNQYSGSGNNKKKKDEDKKPPEAPAKRGGIDILI